LLRHLAAPRASRQGGPIQSQCQRHPARSPLRSGPCRPGTERVSRKHTPGNLPWETRSCGAVQAPLICQQPQSCSAGGAPRCLNTSAPMPAYHGPMLPPENVLKDSTPPELRCALAWPHVSKSRGRNATMLFASAADTPRRARSGQNFVHSGKRLQSWCSLQEKSELSLP